MSAITRALCLSPLILSLAGCAMGNFQASSAGISPQAITGNVHGGQQPVSGATITVWAAGNTIGNVMNSTNGMGATSLGSTTTGPGGNFNFANGFTCPYPNTPIYITAQGGNSGSGTNANLMMMTGLGACSSITTSSYVNINEITTAASVYALAQFISTTEGSGQTDAVGGTVTASDGPAGTYNRGLVVANQYTIPALVNINSGFPVLTNTSGNLTTTVESAKLQSLADVIATCINSNGQTSNTDKTTACGQLFDLTQTPSSSARPFDTVQAALQIVRFPYRNVTPLFNLITANAPYVGLSSAPNDWTLGISYTSTAFGLGINGSNNYSTSTNLDIDATGNVFFPTNSATSHGIGEFSPGTGTFSGPYLTSLTHPQYLAITQQGFLYGSDTLSANIASTSAASPTAAGTVIATTGFTGPIAAESSSTAPDNVVFIGNGTSTLQGSTLYRYNSSGVAQVTAFNQPVDALVTFFQAPGYYEAGTSGVSTACAQEDSFGSSSTSTVASSVTLNGPCYTGGITLTTVGNDFLTTASSANMLCDGAGGNGSGVCFTPPLAVNYPVGIATDGLGAVWIANAANSSVTTFGNIDSNGTASDYYPTSTVQYVHDTNNGSTIKTPYGLAIDRSGNVWLSNAGCVSTTGSVCTPGSFTLSELIGAAGPTTTPLAVQNLNATQGSTPTVVTSNPVQGTKQSSTAKLGRNRLSKVTPK